ncbi:LysM peptidoglycan-binding domain-containing protein [Cupriavidus gilardii]|uniref:FecR domain-containing protein n=1 Tax=Cupriavidus gilardii TaxID=82541 RepID=UPI001EE511E9|nr:FecR domain-containing protein [Cupriavidus gilardii]MCG5258854.1 FecR domain-containing protein [Cupriavidus gilardii]MDF9429016.1 LysM peptidoglycan-binding domain-containing protein [Cupriavidus gilardii]
MPRKGEGRGGVVGAVGAVGAVAVLRVAVAAWSLLAFAPAQAGPAGADGEYFLHEVEPGDTLFWVAQRYTGRADVWRELKTLNRVADPYRLPVGTHVRIPLARIPVTVASARVVSVVGQADANGAALRPGMRVDEAAWLQTGADGLVTFELPDGSRVAMPPNTRLQVKRLRVFAGTGLGDTVMQVDHGGIESRVAPGGSGVGRFEVRTPMMVTGVRGTRYAVDAGQPDETGQRANRSAVLEGTVMVRSRRARRTVAAGHGVAVGTAGNAVVHTLLAPPTLSAVPNEPIYASHAEVGWQPVKGAIGYQVRVTRDAERTEAVFASTVAPASAALTGLPDGPAYLEVRAIDSNRIPGNAAIAPLTVRLNPPAPYTVEPAPQSTVHGTVAQLQWAAVDSAVEYRFEIASDATFDTPAAQGSTREASAQQTLVPGNWWWRVRSVDAKGQAGPWSAPVAFRILPPAPGVTVVEDNGGALRLRWGGAEQPEAFAPLAYRVQLADDPGFARPLQDQRIESDNAALPRPPAGVYYVRVARIERDGSESPFSAPQRIEVHEHLRDGTGAPIGTASGSVRRGG